jgi:transketolase
MNEEILQRLAARVRRDILVTSTHAGSGHPTSSLSAVELMVSLFFGGVLRADLKRPAFPNNDRVIFSKGHASPLYYALYAAAGVLSEQDLLTYRQFGSHLEGHPTPLFPFVEAATGSLGQGLSVGLGIALNARKLDHLPYRTYVLVGDSEMAEGSCWEALEVASHYRLDNLIGILDVNRLGQRGETLLGWDLESYRRRVEAFGWQALLVDGHSFPEILRAYRQAGREGKPAMIIARTVKGKGISFLENQDGWHGKPLPEADLPRALQELGKVDTTLVGSVATPEPMEPDRSALEAKPLAEDYGIALSTRAAYGHALVKIAPHTPGLVVLDAEVGNSTFAATFAKAYPERFFEMFVAEQNMVSVALGLSACGKVPFLSTFGAFLTRAADQLRMAQYARGKCNLKCVGSHVGVSIGADGPSQMALEDLALFRSMIGSTVLYPADHVSTEALVEEAAAMHGLVYLRTTRGDTPNLYPPGEAFPIGGSKTLRTSQDDALTVIAAGITLHEALKAYQTLKEEGILLRLIDLYSIKPLDQDTLEKAACETGSLLVVEDHHPEGGLAEAVRSALATACVPIYSLAVTQLPTSGTPEELLDFEEISARAIVAKVKEILAA